MKESDNYSSATFKVLDRREENCIFFRENKLKFSILLLLPVFDLLEVKVVSQVAKKNNFQHFHNYHSGCFTHFDV